MEAHFKCAICLHSLHHIHLKNLNVLPILELLFFFSFFFSTAATSSGAIPTSCNSFACLKNVALLMRSSAYTFLGDCLSMRTRRMASANVRGLIFPVSDFLLYLRTIFLPKT